MHKPDGQTVFLGSVLVAAAAIVVYLLAFHNDGRAGNPGAAAAPVLRQPNPIDGERAFAMLQRICQLGRRPSGSPGMLAQQRMLTEYFRDLGGIVTLQPFTVRHPEDNSQVGLANLIVQWHPDRRQRVLLCAHYDTRPFPDRDPRRKRGLFIGANDGASGVAALAEIGRHMKDLKGPYGVDFALFDGEEFVFVERRDKHMYFLGSTYFARQYVEQPPSDHRYRAAVLLDMVGDAHLTIRPDPLSLSWPDSRPLIRDIWAVAKQLGIEEFQPRPYTIQITDDHVPLHEIAGLPACDIIDFDYRAPGSRRSFWHTEADTPDKCSADSLAKVSWVLLEWLRRLK
jgi:hypothetical protein